jgi:hypothetical protein
VQKKPQGAKKTPRCKKNPKVQKKPQGALTGHARNPVKTQWGILIEPNFFCADSIG